MAKADDLAVAAQAIRKALEEVTVAKRICIAHAETFHANDLSRVAFDLRSVLNAVRETRLLEDISNV